MRAKLSLVLSAFVFVGCGGGDSSGGGEDVDSGVPIDATGDVPATDSATDARDATSSDSRLDASDTAIGDSKPTDSSTTDSTTSDSGIDTGSISDSGSVSDSGSASDSGTVSDSGSVVDSGTVIDSGVDVGPADAGRCGNAVLDPGEQCDDGNLVNLDGCNATCGFEQDQRAVTFQMIFTTTSTCAKNALGGAVGTLARTTLNDTLTADVKDGSLTLAFEFLGMADLTGATTETVTLGYVNGSPVAAPAGVTYDGTNDLDWWYTSDATTIDGTRAPLSQLGGNVTVAGTTKSLVAGPGPMTFILALVGAPAPMKFSNTMIRATIGASSKPTTSASGNTPGHLASEHDLSTLSTFQTMSAGELCGDISAASLAKIPVPATLLPGGTNACEQNYSASNSLLDVFVEGCSQFGGFVRIINKTQPDTDDPAVAPAGAGPAYTLSASSATAKIVDTCKDHTGATVTFASCLADAAFSSDFSFTTDRVILK